MITEPLMDIKDIIKGRALYNEPMKKHTSFRIGGPAKIWVEPDGIDDLQSLLAAANDNGLAVLITGAGTNLLVSDDGIKGMIISMTSPGLKSIYHDDFKVSVSSTVQISEFLRFLIDHGLGGLEFLAGLPGTVGGAVAMNAGARHYAKKDMQMSVGMLVEKVKTCDFDGNKKIFSKSEIVFNYRSSSLQRLVITEIEFCLRKDDKKKIAWEYGNYLRKRMISQELSLPSAGCVFKNPDNADISAGELIDRCGLKGRRVGGALISQKHANFIVNAGGAMCSDVLALIDIAQNEVKKKFGVGLELEIKVV